MSRVNVPEAKELRAEGYTLQELGDRYGVTRERVRQLVGPAEAKASRCQFCNGPLPTDRDCLMRYCSSLCSGRAAQRRERKECESCGKPCQGVVCKPCKVASWEIDRKRRWDTLERLWAEGRSMKEIAAELGTTENALGGEMVRARAAGRDLPFRRAASPKTENLTKAEARLQFHAALRSGVIRRPARCEGCGSECHVEGHHTDYQRPLYVEWLCGDCHLLAHGKVPLKEAA